MGFVACRRIVVEKVIGRGAAVMTVLVLLVAVALWHRHRRRSERLAEDSRPAT